MTATVRDDAGAAYRSGPATCSAATGLAAWSGSRSAPATKAGRPAAELQRGVPRTRPGLPAGSRGAVLGGRRRRVSGLIGRLDLDGTWWAIMPGIEAAYGSGARERADHQPDRRAYRARGAGLRPMDGPDAGRGHVRGPAGVPGGRERARQPAMGRPRVQHLRRGRGQHRVEDRGGGAGLGRCRAAGELRAGAARGGRADRGERRVPPAQRWPGDLPRDAAAIQAAKRAEFHSLGLVLGYTYAGSPVIQPPARQLATATAATDAAALAGDVTVYTPASEPGARLPHCWRPDGSSLYDALGTGFTLVGPVRRGPGRGRPAGRAAPAASGFRWPWPSRRRPTRGGRSSCSSGPDQHIAWRAADPAEIDMGLVTGHAASPARPRSDVD